MPRPQQRIINMNEISKHSKAKQVATTKTERSAQRTNKKYLSGKHNNELYTGAEFLESLDDGRKVWFDGEKISTISKHPAFKNAALSVARFYDSLHNPELEDDLLLVDSFGITTHKFFAPSYTNQELDAARKAIAIVQKINYGWMGRTPDYKASFMAHLSENSKFYQQQFQGNALTWYKRYARKALHLNHVLVDPPVDRTKERMNVRDVFVSVDKEDDRGIYVSGAKMVATGSALTHATFVGLTGNITSQMQKDRDEDMAVIFFAAMNTPGLSMISRPSYELKATSAYEAPLSARFDENDAVIIFDKAFIPWENVLVYRDIQRCKNFYTDSGFFSRYNLQGAVRLAVKLDFCIGLLSEGLKCSGTNAFRGIQAGLGELIGIRNTVWGLTTAMVNDTEPCGQGLIPKQEIAATTRLYTSTCWSHVRNLFEDFLAGAPIYTISSEKDLAQTEISGLIERYYRGTGFSAYQRLKLFKLIWDAIYSEFAGRHSLYEKNYSGSQEMKRIDLLKIASGNGSLKRCSRLVETCMNDYDEKGWKHTWS